jgi:hypothetical protein
VSFLEPTVFGKLKSVWCLVQIFAQHHLSWKKKSSHWFHTNGVLKYKGTHAVKMHSLKWHNILSTFEHQWYLFLHTGIS